MNTALNLGLSILLARTLGPEGFGVYAFALSVTTLLAVPVQMGIPTLLLREVARYRHAADWSRLRGVLTRMNQSVLLLSVLIGLSAAGVLFSLGHVIDAMQLSTLTWALLLLPLTAVNRLREAALQGLQWVIIAQLPDKLIMPVTLFVLLAVFHNLIGLTPALAMTLFCCAAGLALISGAAALARALPPVVWRSEPKYEMGTWMRSVLPLSVLAGLSVVNTQTDVVMLGVLATSEAVGLYRVAFSGAALVIFTLTAVNAVISPHIVRLHQSGDQVRLQRLVTLAVRWTSLAALPVAAMMVLFGAPILDSVFGTPYRAASHTLAILCIAQLVNVAVGSVHVILNMTGNEAATVRGALLGAALNVVLNATLIPRFGLEGAAVATGISIVVVNIVLLRAVWVRTGIWPLVVGRATRPGVECP